MAGLALYRLAARFCDDIQRIPRQSRVVNDAGTRVALENALRQQTNDVVTLDKAAVFIEQETSVKITIPAYAKIRAIMMPDAKALAAEAEKQAKAKKDNDAEA